MLFFGQQSAFDCSVVVLLWFDQWKTKK